MLAQICVRRALGGDSSYRHELTSKTICYLIYSVFFKHLFFRHFLLDDMSVFERDCYVIFRKSYILLKQTKTISQMDSMNSQTILQYFIFKKNGKSDFKHFFIHKIIIMKSLSTFEVNFAGWC